jgi:hypothetical protein
MRTDLNIPDPDAFYEAILQANEDLTTEQSLAFVLRLALVLANQVGDQAALVDAIKAAKQCMLTRTP